MVAKKLQEKKKLKNHAKSVYQKGAKHAIILWKRQKRSFHFTRYYIYCHNYWRRHRKGRPNCRHKGRQEQLRDVNVKSNDDIKGLQAGSLGKNGTTHWYMIWSGETSRLKYWQDNWEQVHEWETESQVTGTGHKVKMIADKSYCDKRLCAGRDWGAEGVKWTGLRQESAQIYFRGCNCQTTTNNKTYLVKVWQGGLAHRYQSCFPATLFLPK